MHAYVYLALFLCAAMFKLFLSLSRLQLLYMRNESKHESLFVYIVFIYVVYVSLQDYLYPHIDHVLIDILIDFFSSVLFRRRNDFSRIDSRKWPSRRTIPIITKVDNRHYIYIYITSFLKHIYINFNQKDKKNHRNGIFRAKRQRYPSLKGVS